MAIGEIQPAAIKIDNALMFKFIETPFFTKAIEHYLDNDEYARLQHHLTRIIHERFCCHRGFAAATSLAYQVDGKELLRREMIERGGTSRLGLAGSPLVTSTDCWGLAPFFLAPVPVLTGDRHHAQTRGKVSVPWAPRARLATRLRDCATNCHE